MKGTPLTLRTFFNGIFFGYVQLHMAMCMHTLTMFLKQPEMFARSSKPNLNLISNTHTTSLTDIPTNEHIRH